MAELSEAQHRKIACWTALKAYLDAVFADERLEKLLIANGADVKLFKAGDAETDKNGKSVTVVYGINGIGVYRTVEDPLLFQKTFHYRWGHHNSAFALAFSLARDSQGALKPEDLEAKLGSYRQAAAGNAETVPEAGK